MLLLFFFFFFLLLVLLSRASDGGSKGTVTSPAVSTFLFRGTHEDHTANQSW